MAHYRVATVTSSNRSRQSELGEIAVPAPLGTPESTRGCPLCRGCNEADNEKYRQYVEICRAATRSNKPVLCESILEYEPNMSHPPAPARRRKMGRFEECREDVMSVMSEVQVMSRAMIEDEMRRRKMQVVYNTLSAVLNALVREKVLYTNRKGGRACRNSIYSTTPLPMR